MKVSIVWRYFIFYPHNFKIFDFFCNKIVACLSVFCEVIKLPEGGRWEKWENLNCLFIHPTTSCSSLKCIFCQILTLLDQSTIYFWRRAIILKQKLLTFPHNVVETLVLIKFQNVFQLNHRMMKRCICLSAFKCLSFYILLIQTSGGNSSWRQPNTKILFLKIL